MAVASLEPSMPLVFQCRSCNTIVGDSLSIESTNERLGALTLSRVSSLQRSDDITTSTAPADRGSTYQALQCVHCTARRPRPVTLFAAQLRRRRPPRAQARVGRVYVTTVPDLDELRGRYTLDTEAICSYELGGGGGDAALPPRVPGDVEADLRAELAKMQGVILSIHERLAAVEARPL